MTTDKTKSKKKAVTFQVQTTILKTKPTASAEKDETPRNTAAEMSVPEKAMLCMMVDEAPELPYPRKPLTMAYGPDEEVYDIPEDAKSQVLDDLYPFCPAPLPDSQIFDLHEQKLFVFREAQVIRHKNRNLIVSPFYAHSGGMAVDFLPPECAEAEDKSCVQTAKA